MQFSTGDGVNNIKTLILSGFGTNCENETRLACRLAGAGPVDVRHINGIYSGEVDLEDYRFLVLIGGFLDGDDLGGARACANRFRYRSLPGGGTFLESLIRFVEQDRLVLGICNGFQLLVKLGLLPGSLTGETRPEKQPEQSPDNQQVTQQVKQRVTLTNNSNGRFEDRWVNLRADGNSPCVFTRGMEMVEMPIRHGEGRLIGESAELPEKLVQAGLVPLRYADRAGTPTMDYPDNPNGSPLGMAALCNARGTVMGLMPHPEAYHHYTNHPRWTREHPRPPADESGGGLVLFRNAYQWLRGQ